MISKPVSVKHRHSWFGRRCQILMNISDLTSAESCNSNVDTATVATKLQRTLTRACSKEEVNYTLAGAITVTVAAVREPKFEMRISASFHESSAHCWPLFANFWREREKKFLYFSNLTGLGFLYQQLGNFPDQWPWNFDCNLILFRQWFYWSFLLWGNESNWSCSSLPRREKP